LNAEFNTLSEKLHLNFAKSGFYYKNSHGVGVVKIPLKTTAWMEWRACPTLMANTPAFFRNSSSLVVFFLLKLDDAVIITCVAFGVFHG